MKIYRVKFTNIVRAILIFRPNLVLDVRILSGEKFGAFFFPRHMNMRSCEHDTNKYRNKTNTPETIRRKEVRVKY